MKMRHRWWIKEMLIFVVVEPILVVVVAGLTLIEQIFKEIIEL